MFVQEAAPSYTDEQKAEIAKIAADMNAKADAIAEGGDGQRYQVMLENQMALIVRFSDPLDVVHGLLESNEPSVLTVAADGALPGIEGNVSHVTYLSTRSIVLMSLSTARLPQPTQGPKPVFHEDEHGNLVHSESGTIVQHGPVPEQAQLKN